LVTITNHLSSSLRKFLQLPVPFSRSVQIPPLHCVH
jgi:hypothetical protein